jgi:hypothetical protein
MGDSTAHFHSCPLPERETSDAREFTKQHREMRTLYRDYRDVADIVVDLALRIVPAGNALLDRTAQAKPAPRYQEEVTSSAWRFADCETHFSNAECNYVLKAVQANVDFERRCWFEQIIGCKRRDQKGWASSPPTMTC